MNRYPFFLLLFSFVIANCSNSSEQAVNYNDQIIQIHSEALDQSFGNEYSVEEMNLAYQNMEAIIADAQEKINELNAFEKDIILKEAGQSLLGVIQSNQLLYQQAIDLKLIDENYVASV